MLINPQKNGENLATFISERMLRKALEELKQGFGCVALKVGAEAEANSFEEIGYFHKLASSIVPVEAKIGGPTAQNDIRTFLKIGVSGIIVPMIESPYGLRKSVNSLRHIMTKSEFHVLQKSMMIETLDAYNQLHEILGMPEAKIFDKIIIGRSDLSRSMVKNLDDPDVTEVCRKIARKTHEIGLRASIGGGVTPSNAKMIVEDIGVDELVTMHVAFKVKSCPDVSEAVRKGLEFETIVLEKQKEKLRKQISDIEHQALELKKGVIFSALWSNYVLGSFSSF